MYVYEWQQKATSQEIVNGYFRKISDSKWARNNNKQKCFAKPEKKNNNNNNGDTIVSSAVSIAQGIWFSGESGPVHRQAARTARTTDNDTVFTCHPHNMTCSYDYMVHIVKWKLKAESTHKTQTNKDLLLLEMSLLNVSNEKHFFLSATAVYCLCWWRCKKNKI